MERGMAAGREGAKAEALATRAARRRDLAYSHRDSGKRRIENNV